MSEEMRKKVERTCDSLLERIDRVLSENCYAHEEKALFETINATVKLLETLR